MTPEQFATFDLAGGPFARLAARYETLRDETGLALQDAITFGVPEPGESFLRLLFTRHRSGPPVEATLFVDAARAAGAAGLAVVRSGLASSLQTRFGPFEAAGVSVSRAGRVSPCLTFRHTADVLTITGLMCGTDAKPADLATLACALDKLDLVSAGDDLALRDWFLAAERQRGLGCLDARAARSTPVDPLRPISSVLRGSLATATPKGSIRQLSRQR